MKAFILAIFLIYSVPIWAQKDKQWQMMWWNVENLFHPEIDSLNTDTEYTPEGNYHWTFTRYYHKLSHIAQVVVNASGWEDMAIIGICEVENEQCIKDLCSFLRCDNYKYIHYDSPDKRGIDIALLYNPRIHILESRPIPIALPNGHTTRDILYARFLSPTRDTTALFLCHFPSMLGGYNTSRERRDIARKTLQNKIDSLVHSHPHYHIIVMGDMNDEVKDNLRGVSNQMLSQPRAISAALSYAHDTIYNTAVKGTHKHQGIWSYLDQCYLSESTISTLHPWISIYAPDYLLEDDERHLSLRPKRTFIGMRYQREGYSDHLPILLRFQK